MMRLSEAQCLATTANVLRASGHELAELEPAGFDAVAYGRACQEAMSVQGRMPAPEAFCAATARKTALTATVDASPAPAHLRIEEPWPEPEEPRRGLRVAAFVACVLAVAFVLVNGPLAAVALLCISAAVGGTFLLAAPGAR